MAFRRSDLQEAFFVHGTQPFRARLAPRADHQDRPGAARAYGTTDPLEKVLAPGYFEFARGLLRAGELIDVSIVLEGLKGRPGDPPGVPGATELPLTDAPPAPPKRGRGRPPGSKTRKPT